MNKMLNVGLLSLVSFFIFIFLIGFVSFGNVSTWDEYDNETYITTTKPIKIRHDTTTTSLGLIINPDGSIKQLPWYQETPRKLAIKANSNLQFENVIINKNQNELKDAIIYKKDWQLPVNATILVRQYKTDPKTGSIDFSKQSTVYALSATSETIMVVQWIKQGFKPYVINDPTTKVLTGGNPLPIPTPDIIWTTSTQESQ